MKYHCVLIAGIHALHPTALGGDRALSTRAAAASTEDRAAALDRTRDALLGRRSPRSTPASSSNGNAAAVIVGAGRIGGLLAGPLCAVEGDVVMRRGDPFPENVPPEGPIYVCTRNDVLGDVIAATPEDRRDDLCFLQNGMLGPFLASHGLEDATQVLVYLAVAKLGEAPTDGITDTNPEGLTTATGKWADAFKARLAQANLTCHVKNGDSFTQAMLEKHIWICAFMLVGAGHGGITVGDVESLHRDEFAALANELAAAGSNELGVVLEDGLVDRLCAYGRAVSHFPTAVKEVEWRNGWFYDISLRELTAGRPDPMPLHTAGLQRALGDACPM